MANRGVTLKDVPADKFVVAYAAHLKTEGKLNVPKWVNIVKTATHKELSPYDPDWFYVRVASVARQVYLKKKGVGGLAIRYGGSARRGTRPNTFSRGSTNIARKALKALEALQIVEVDQANGGRRVTSKGRKELDRIAFQVAQQHHV